MVVRLNRKSAFCLWTQTFFDRLIIQDRDFFHWVEHFWLTEKPFVPLLASSSALFNPFRADKNWLDNKHQIAPTSH
jgi:hypothetical protein